MAERGVAHVGIGLLRSMTKLVLNGPLTPGNAKKDEENNEKLESKPEAKPNPLAGLLGGLAKPSTSPTANPLASLG